MSAGLNAAQCRALFAGFLPELQAAMKQAALRYDWDGETWAMQTILLAETIERSGYDPKVIAALTNAYREGPQLFKEAA
jgi:hypothetical protein